MGYILNYSKFEMQLNELMSKIIYSVKQLGIWTDVIVDLRCLQMEGLVDDDRIDMMESYIDDCKLIVQDMAEKVIHAHQVLHTNIALQEQFLEYHHHTLGRILSKKPLFYLDSNTEKPV